MEEEGGPERTTTKDKHEYNSNTQRTVNLSSETQRKTSTHTQQRKKRVTSNRYIHRSHGDGDHVKLTNATEEGI